MGAAFFSTGLALCCAAPAAASHVISANSSGWINSSGVVDSTGPGTGINNNFTGFEDEVFRHWFEVTLRNRTTACPSFSLYNRSNISTMDPNALYILVQSLSFSFARLNTGPWIATMKLGVVDTGFNQYVNITANDGGTTELDAALSGEFIFGGATTSDVVEIASCCDDCVAAFGFSGGYPVATLSVSAVPEPSTWAMMAIGFSCLGLAAIRRRGALTWRAAAGGRGAGVG